MKLYFNPGVCSLSPHIVLREAGFDFDLEKVDFATKKTESGADFNQINSKSVVPVLEFDNGERLTEGPAIVQYLADQKPQAGLAPKNGTLERSRLQEWLNFTTSEIHKGFYPLFHKEVGEQAAKAYREKLAKAFSYVNDKLKGRDYLMGDKFTIADAYMFTVVNWTNFVGIDLAPWPALAAYQKRVAARPKVREAMIAEGLLKAEAA